MDLKQILKPVWKGGEVIAESAMYLEGNEEVKLMFPPKEIRAVRDFTGALLRAGADYEQTEEGIRFLPAGNAPRLSREKMFPKDAESDFFALKEGGKIFFTEGGFFHRHQVFVDYAHEPSAAYEPETVKGGLSATKKLLEEGKLNLLFYGDSITCGANASAEIYAIPFQNAYPKLVLEGLAARYPYAQISYANTAEGGQTSEWGLKNVQERLIDRAPDLLVLAFGMNDGTWFKDEGAFDGNIRGILNAVRETLPDTEIILVSPVLPNPLPCMKFDDGALVPFCGIQEKYPPVLRRIAEDYGVSFVNMTGFHQKLLQRKRYYEMTGNNVNHPNDFLHRCYAQIILSLLEEEK